MQISRRIIDTSTQIICYLKRNRRINPENMSTVVKINLGCGLAVAKGWINIDGSLNAFIASWPRVLHRLLYRFTGANRYYSCAEYCSLLENYNFIHHDLSYGIPFVNESVNFVYSSHFLEHLRKQDAFKLLFESYRVLKLGGIIRICIPDLAYAVSLYGAGEKEKMLNSYFFNEDNENYLSIHKYMYDFELLKNMLEKTGFKDIVCCSYREGLTPDLDFLDNRPEESLYVEAIKR